MSRWPRPPCLSLVLILSAVFGNTLGWGDSCRLAHVTKNGAMPQGQSEAVPLPNFLVMESNNQDSWGVTASTWPIDTIPLSRSRASRMLSPSKKEKRHNSVWRLSWMERLWDKSPIALVLGMTPGVSSSLTRLLRRPPCRFVALTSVSQPHTFFIGTGPSYFSGLNDEYQGFMSPATSATRAPRRSTSARILSSVIPFSSNTLPAFGMAFCSGNTFT